MQDFYKQFCEEGFDQDGVLNRFKIHCPNSFNFGYDVIDAIAAKEPNRRAMVWTNDKGEERIFTFADMAKYSNKTANLFSSYGIKKGDKVLLILKRHYQFWFAILALHKLGAVTIPATNLLTAKDIAYRIDSAAIHSIVCTSEGDVSLYADQAQQKCPQLQHKFMARGSREGWIDFDAEVEKQSDVFERVETSIDDSMLLYFTSGTTGQPKMVVHDFGYPLAHIITARYWHNCNADGLHLAVAETGWGKAVWGKLYGQWLMAAGIFVYDFDGRFQPADLLSIIEKYKITTFCAPPTIYRFFIKEGMDGYDLSSLEYATTAGEALNEEVFNRFKEYTGLSLMEGFGQTETTLQVANLQHSTPKPGSMGKPSPLYNVDIVDDDLVSVADGEVGEIVLRPHEDGSKNFGLFKEYLNDPTMTKKAWTNGVYHTGDTAYRDEDGFLWYVGRTDDIIKASGYRIGPFEVESVLMEHPAVLECAVTGAPDPIRGQVVKATIVLTKNYTPSAELVKEIQTYVKHATAPYKYPRIIDFVEELPKTISGKIRRVDLRKEK